MAKITEKAFIKQTVISIAIIIGCMFCLTFSSWAMFSDCVTDVKQTLKAANFSVSTEITDSNSGAAVTPSAKNTFILSEGTYTVTINAKGTAVKNSGYAVVKIGETCLYSPQLLPAAQEGVAVADAENTFPSGITFTLNIAGDSLQQVTVTSVWGTLAVASTNPDSVIGDTVNIDAPVTKEENTEEAVEPDQTEEVSSETSSIASETESTVQEESETPSEVSNETSSASSEETLSSEESSAIQSTTTEE